MRKAFAHDKQIFQYKELYFGFRNQSPKPSCYYVFDAYEWKTSFFFSLLYKMQSFLFLQFNFMLYNKQMKLDILNRAIFLL